MKMFLTTSTLRMFVPFQSPTFTLLCCPQTKHLQHHLEKNLNLSLDFTFPYEEVLYCSRSDNKVFHLLVEDTQFTKVIPVQQFR